MTHGISSLAKTSRPRQRSKSKQKSSANYSTLLDIIEVIRDLRNIYWHETIAGLKVITEEIKEIKASVEEVKKATKEKSSTYAAITALTSEKPALDPKVLKVREQKTASRKERAKYEVTLAATTDESKKKLSAMSYKDITERIQSTINTNVHHNERPSVFGVSKPTKEGTVRVRCETEE